MKKIFYLWICLAGTVFFTSCQKDDPDTGNSIFDINAPERNSFEQWLLNNYTIPYNIQVYYLMKDVETDYTYNVVPADLQKSKQMAFLLKFLWLEAYESVATDSVHFIRKTVPRVFHYIGSAQYNNDGTRTLGVAEGGAKITVAEVNELDPKNIIYQNFFSTVHHEYAHILHQMEPIPVEFNQITPEVYAPTTWQNRTEVEAAELGLVSQYAGKLPSEDFVEVLARYLTWTAAQWDAKLVQAGEVGAPIIEEKLVIVKNYMRSIWGVDVDELKTEVQRRANEIQFMDFDNLGF